MKILGLIGGMSWESTAMYYQYINQIAQNRLGGLHSAKMLIWSFDFQEIANAQSQNNWAVATDKMCDTACRLKSAGAEAIVICTNTMHKMADQIEQSTQLPVIYIADATAKAIQRRKISKVGLLATRYTMEQDFYKNRIIERYGINILIPEEEDRVKVHNIIYNELCRGIINEHSKRIYQAVICKLIGHGAQGIILGCTEIGLLIKSGDVEIPIFDTTYIHAQEAVNFALN